MVFAVMQYIQLYSTWRVLHSANHVSISYDLFDRITSYLISTDFSMI